MAEKVAVKCKLSNALYQVDAIKPPEQWWPFLWLPTSLPDKSYSVSWDQSLPEVILISNQYAFVDQKIHQNTNKSRHWLEINKN